MLKIMIWCYTTDTSEFVENSADYFDGVYEKEWLSDPFIQEMIMEVDKTTVNSDLTITSPILGDIIPKQLSGGVKTLILLYKGLIKARGARMGENCYPYVERIAKDLDVYLLLDWLPPFSSNMTAEILNSGKIVHSYHEFLNEYIKEQHNDPFIDWNDYEKGEYDYLEDLE